MSDTHPLRVRTLRISPAVRDAVARYEESRPDSHDSDLIAAVQRTADQLADPRGYARADSERWTTDANGTQVRRMILVNGKWLHTACMACGTWGVR